MANNGVNVFYLCTYLQLTDLCAEVCAEREREREREREHETGRLGSGCLGSLLFRAFD